MTIIMHFEPKIFFVCYSNARSHYFEQKKFARKVMGYWDTFSNIIFFSVNQIHNILWLCKFSQVFFLNEWIEQSYLIRTYYVVNRWFLKSVLILLNIF